MKLFFIMELMIYQKKLNFIKKMKNQEKKIAKNGKKKYFNLFNEVKITKYIIDKSLI